MYDKLHIHTNLLSLTVQIGASKQRHTDKTKQYKSNRENSFMSSLEAGLDNAIINNFFTFTALNFLIVFEFFLCMWLVVEVSIVLNKYGQEIQMYQL